MTAPIWIAACVTCFLCLGILFAQHTRNDQLHEKVASLREVIADMEERTEDIQPTSTRHSSSTRRSSHDSGDALPSTASLAPTASTSSERIARARKRVEFLVTDIQDLDLSPTLFIKLLPDLLRSVEDLSLDEMFQLIAQLDSPDWKDSDSGKGATRMILLLLAAEQDPLRVLQTKEFMEDRQMRTGIVGAYARQNPEAAIQWLDRTDYIDSNEKIRIKAAIIRQTLRTDVNAALSMLREMQKDDTSPQSMMIFAYAPVSKESVPDLVSAVQDPANQEIQSTLTRMIFSSSLMTGGLDEARKHFANVDLSKPSIRQSLQEGFQAAMESHPRETIEWATEIHTDEELLSVVPNLLRSWAGNDYNAAGNWLGDLEPSLMRDKSIEAFASTINAIDPEGAAIWAQQIDDSTTRERSSQSVLALWRRKDKEAANSWMAENGIQLEIP
ncbi:MAG: hypothetical protein AAGH89_16265 [Verrucomicrobiota bacterium]